MSSLVKEASLQKMLCKLQTIKTESKGYVRLEHGLHTRETFIFRGSDVLFIPNENKKQTSNYFS